MARLILTVAHADRAFLPARTEQEFDEAGGSIGRSPENTLHLPDPERYVSSRHARIEFERGEFFLVDTSVNGVYIDGAHSPVGRDNRVLLTDGMVIEMGDYTLYTKIVRPVGVAPFQEYGFDDSPSGDPTLRPENDNLLDLFDSLSGLDPTPPSVHNHAGASRVEYEALSNGFFTDSAFTPAPPIPDAARSPSGEQASITGTGSGLDIPERWDLTDFSAAVVSEGAAPFIPEQWDRTDLGAAAYAHLNPENPSTTSPQNPAAITSSRSSTQHRPTSQNPQSDAFPFPAAGSESCVDGDLPPTGGALTTADALTQDLMSMLSGMGVEASPQEAVKLARQWMTAMPVVLEGLIELLRVRAEIKSQLRADKTSIQVNENNPLKFSNTAATAVEALFLNPRPGFMDAQSALAQVMEDLTLHQKAMTAGVQGGLDALTQRLSPKAIEARCAQQKAGQGLLSSLSKPDHWRAYCETFDLIMRHSDMSFLDVFGKEFVSAYEKELGKQKSGRGRN